MLLLLACEPESADDVGNPGDADTDADTDSDSDAGTDSDTDSGDTGDTGDTAQGEFRCPDGGDYPSLSTSNWGATGVVPGGAVISLVGADDDSILYAGSHNSGMFSTTDSAKSWDRAITGTPHTWADLAISPDDPYTVYRSSGGVLEVSPDGGRTWTTLDLGRVDPQNGEYAWAVAVAPWDADRLYGVTHEGQAYLSDDGGKNFDATGVIPTEAMGVGEDPFNNHAWRLLPTPESGGRLVFTDSFVVYTSDDEGDTWTARALSSFGGHSLQRDPNDADHLVLGGTEGLWSSWDGGTNWELDDSFDSVISAAWSPDGSRLAVGTESAVWVTDDGGDSWWEAPHSFVMAEGLYVMADGTVLLAWDEGMATLHDEGDDWEDRSDGMEDPGIAVVAPHPVCDNLVFIGSRCSGGLYRSADWGGEWHHIDHYFHYVMSLHYDPSDLWHIYAVSDDSLLESWDAGESWSDLYVKYHFHGFAIHPDNPEVLLIGSVGSGEWADQGMHLYRSEDAGQSWVDNSDGLPKASQASAHTIVYWPNNPDVVLLGTYKGGDASHRSGDGEGLFRSTDGGESWEESDLPADEIAWLSIGADNTVFAATEDGIWRSSDEGVSWEQLDGPSGILLSADFHGALGVALAQSGPVYLTDDNGESWTKLNAGLPSNPTTWLAQVAISADETTAWATVFDEGVYRIALP